MEATPPYRNNPPQTTILHTYCTDYKINHLTNPPQSQAIRANGQIFVSGQIPADSSANLIEGNIGEKTQACCDNIKAILTAAGSSVDKIVKVNVCGSLPWFITVVILDSALPWKKEVYTSYKKDDDLLIMNLFLRSS